MFSSRLGRSEYSARIASRPDDKGHRDLIQCRSHFLRVDAVGRRRPKRNPRKHEGVGDHLRREGERGNEQTVFDGGGLDVGGSGGAHASGAERGGPVGEGGK